MPGVDWRARETDRVMMLVKWDVVFFFVFLGLATIAGTIGALTHGADGGEASIYMICGIAAVILGVYLFRNGLMD